ncbi:FprA family A-type flavoprotein [Paludibacter sp. 221]|uniref:FprA family A-type flavoprotein n=1 Tax=Paludibacter sp. 221 TaxID=2302939 RepID=UPI0013D891A0|nr:FprA family A-type flavoprotein [Paludibacter sp. 221]NDV47734.1 FprA family A-type flavoprotein [Paludibacter sp. 221]
MYKNQQIAKNIYYAGVNDRQKTKFENLHPLPYGVSYNSYLIVDEKIALVETVDACFGDEFIDKIQSQIANRPIDYLIVNHMEPDHSGSIRQLRLHYPDVTIVGNAKTLSMIEGYYGMTNNVLEVKDGDTLSLGTHELQFHLTPMVHWPETMMTYDTTEKVLFSGDAFGCFGALNGAVLDTEMNLSPYWDEMIRYYANIVGKYGSPVQKALEKLSGIRIDTICSTHGPVWTKHIPEVVSIYDKLSRYEHLDEGVVIVYGSMYGNTERMAEATAQGLAQAGVKNIIVHNASKSDPSVILRDIFKYNGLIIGSPTYSNELYPEIDSLLKKIEIRGIKNRTFGYFGSFTWAGAAVKRLTAFAEQMKWETAPIVPEEKQGLKPEAYNKCIELGEKIASMLKKA